MPRSSTFPVLATARRRPAALVVVALALALLPALLPAPATAQVTGLYYQEVEKDGRIYVFNTPERYQAFQASGQMEGAGIQLIGRGPNGETIVAENETALDLYFFKHNLPGYERPTPKPAAPAFTVSWKDGKTTIESKSARLDLSNRGQVRFTQEDREVEPAGDPNRGSFRIRRFKTKMEGWVYTKDLTYELQLNWPDTANPLEDANVNYDLTKGRKLFQLKAGQYKVPFGRQELTSSGNQQFVDRGQDYGRFARGRDIGVQLWGTPMAGKLDWRVGIFNGNGRTVTRNDNDDFQLNARVTWQPFGDVKYSESDFESTDKPLFALGAEYENREFPVAAAGSTPAHANDRTITGLDAVFKYKGFSAFAERFDAENDRLGPLSTVDEEYLIAQVGYFVLPKRLEVAARWAEWDPNADLGNNEREERGIGVGYFWNKHPHKLQADYREYETKGVNTTDKEFRLQYQIIF